jgi:hypothetical protein
VVVSPGRLRAEARICREIAREISDPAGRAMMRDRAVDLERRAASLEQYTASASEPVAAGIPAIRRSRLVQVSPTVNSERK